MQNLVKFSFCLEVDFLIRFLILGSESINQALIGGVRALNVKRRTIIASGFERPAVNETLEYLLMN